VGGVSKPVVIGLDVTRRLQAEREAIDVLVGVIPRTEVRVHDGLHHLVTEVESREV
jgi:hypothetical protein